MGVEKKGGKPKRSLIGTAYRKVDGLAKSTGATRFADDLSMPRMLFVKLLRSDVAHARSDGIERRLRPVVERRERDVPSGLGPAVAQERAHTLRPAALQRSDEEEELHARRGC